MNEAQIMVHVRFAPDGSVTEIGERPQDLTAQAWFNRLTRTSGEAFHPLSGGRAYFRLGQAQLDAVKTMQ